MGFTHYWTQKRRFIKAEWIKVCSDVCSILSYAENVANISLGDGWGNDKPIVNGDHIIFNGSGEEDSHESFEITRVIPPLEDWQRKSQRGWSFCKTARKPYDKVVVACLCYFATVTETHSVSSDGNGSDWVDGLELARLALPQYSNILDIPRTILEEDRWCGPWISHQSGSGYEVRFCVDGHGYVYHKRSKQWYRFESHHLLADFLYKHKQAHFSSSGRTSWGYYSSVETDIWNASGCFDEKRTKRIAKAQGRVLSQLFPTDNKRTPPLFVRPGEFASPETRAYYIKELLEKVS